MDKQRVYRAFVVWSKARSRFQDDPVGEPAALRTACSPLLFAERQSGSAVDIGRNLAAATPEVEAESYPRTLEREAKARCGGILPQGLRGGYVLALTLAILMARGQVDTSPKALDPGAFGTRAGAPMQRVTTPEGGSLGWAQLGIALLIVAAGLRWGLPKLLRWAGKTGDGSPIDGQIKIIETRSALGGSLMLVKARDRLLLIGATAQGMQLLADLTDTLPKPEPAAITESAFEQVLRRAQPAAPPTDLQAEAAAQVQTRLQQTRARLQSLIGDQR